MTDRLDEKLFRAAAAERCDTTRYENRLRRTLDALPDAPAVQRTAQRPGRAVRRALLIAALCTLASCTALAAVRLGFMHFVQHYDPETGGDLTGLYVEGALASCETAHVRYELRAASCDGSELQFVVAAMPRASDTALTETDPDSGARAEALALSPNLRRTEIGLAPAAGDTSFDSLGIASQREGSGLVFGAYARVNVEPGDEIRFTIDCADSAGDTPDLARAQMTFSFQSAGPQTAAYAADADLGSVRVTRVSLSHTALALHAVIEYAPLRDRKPDFRLVLPDGTTASGGYGMQEEDGVYRARCVYATSQEMPETLLLWPYSERDDCTRALAIDTRTGSTRVVSVTPTLGGTGTIRVAL